MRESIAYWVFREVTMLYVDRWIEWIEQSRSLAQEVAANSRKVLVVCYDKARQSLACQLIKPSKRRRGLNFRFQCL